jgi:hypothetical protein
VFDLNINVDYLLNINIHINDNLIKELL